MRIAPTALSSRLLTPLTRVFQVGQALQIEPASIRLTMRDEDGDVISISSEATLRHIVATTAAATRSAKQLPASMRFDISILSAAAGTFVAACSAAARSSAATLG
mmetsp:Transcript_8796/g.19560  ORF Transcript_8796/g.19560 Transcript_8796/m.19560 type:complete len:105 (-) Transcript_8796:4-318(-)